MLRIGKRAGRKKPFIFWMVSLTMLLLFFGVLSAMVSAQSPKTIRVGAYNNPPKISVDDHGNVTGFWPDLLAYIAEKEGWQVEYIPGTWTDGLKNLQSGVIDIMPDVAFTEERAAKYTFSNDPVLESWTRLYVAQDNTDIQTIKDLDGGKIAGLAGSVNLEGPNGLYELIRNFDLHVTVVEMEDYQSVFRAIETGMVNAGITNRNFGDKFAGDYAVKPTSIIFQPITLKFAFPKNSSEAPYFAERIDAQMAALKQNNDSVYYQLLAKYFETSIAEKKVVPRWLTRAMQIGVFLLIVFGLAFITARYQIARQTQEIREKNEELRESEERYRTIYNSTSDAIFIQDAETGKILDANKAAMRMYGYERQEIMNLNIGALSSGADLYTEKQATKKIQRTVEKNENRFDWQAVDKQGKIFWVDVSLKKATINGEARIVAVVRDIDRRKKAEDDLAAEKERLAVTLNSIGDGVIATDKNGKIVMINKVAQRLTGWQWQDAVGQDLLEVFTIVDANSDKLRADPVSKVLASGEIIDLANHTVLVAKDGTRRSIADSGAPICNAKSEIIGVILVFRDVTEKQKSEAAMMKIKKLESVGVLAGGIAHDFNNILTAILGNISLARMGLSPQDLAYPLLEAAEKASLRAKDLTQQLLTFSKGGDPVKQTASIEKIINDSASFVLHGTSVSYQIDCPDNLYLANVDAGQISQVIQNIVLNARDAMPTGGAITIKCTNVDDIKTEKPNLPAGKYLKITIDDTGGGIPEKYLEKIFDPYFSTKQHGSGLGLAITHSIVLKHNGDIDVKSTMGKGTSFSIYLPASPEQILKTPFVPEAQMQLKNATILVMDDEKIVREVLQSMLENFGYRVLTAKDGREAINIYREYWAKNEAIDLVIMDLTIPGGMGGKEAVQIVLDINPDAKVLVSSGYSNDPILANYAAYGFSGALVKPFRIDDLDKTLHTLLA